MTCKQFLDALDSYVDGELAADATAAADLHRRECQGCGRMATGASTLKAAVRRTIEGLSPPPGLESRVRAQLDSASRYRAGSILLSRGRWALSAAAMLAIAVVLTAATRAPIARAANTLDRLAVRLDDHSAVVLDATVLCRDCELEHRHGIRANCRTIGHHGALVTTDGRIWNIVEDPASERLIHDGGLLGRRVRVEGYGFRGARAVVVTSYRVTS